MITQLSLQSFRNIASCRIDRPSKLNIITGQNGAGKTSILEAIYVLSHQQSLRCARLESAVQAQAESFVLSCHLTSGAHNHQLGMEKHATSPQKQVRMNGEAVHRRKATLALLPVIWIGPESFRDWFESPEDRRSFLDWGLFHVEHEFLSCHQQYKRALQHRNQLLKQQAPDGYFEPWERLMSEHGMRLQRFREAYLEALGPTWRAYWQLLGGSHAIDVEWKSGWHSDEHASLGEALAHGRPRERLVGSTLYGPHRAQWTLCALGNAVQHVLSRGQMKSLVVAMWLAQAAHVLAHAGKKAVILADDLPAELDRATRERLWAVLAQMPNQLWLTALNPEDFPAPIQELSTMFHVEHGCVEPAVTSAPC